MARGTFSPNSYTIALRSIIQRHAKDPILPLRCRCQIAPAADLVGSVVSLISNAVSCYSCTEVKAASGPINEPMVVFDPPQDLILSTIIARSPSLAWEEFGNPE